MKERNQYQAQSFWFQQEEEGTVIFRDEGDCREIGGDENEELDLRQVKFYMVIRH